MFQKHKVFVLAFLIFLDIIFLSLDLNKAQASTSLWSQTDWSGGSGQTSWSDSTKFSSSSSIDYNGTSGQITLEQSGGGGTWFNSAWDHRRKITFDNSSQAENLTNFVVLVKLDSSRIDYSATQDSGQDIRFTDSDGETLLSYEIEDWNESGTSIVWVEVPQIDSSSNTDYIYMYYGNTSASDAQDPDNTWNDNYLSVWHMNEDPQSTTDGPCGDEDYYNICDSSGNSVNLLNSGNTTSISDHVIGKAVYFDGDNDWLDTDWFPSITTTFTISGWVIPLSFSNYPSLVNVHKYSSQEWRIVVEDAWTNPTYLRCELSYTGNESNSIRSYSDYYLGAYTWHYFSYTKTLTGTTCYVDTYTDGTVSTSGTVYNHSSLTPRIGARLDGSQDLNGAMDEVRIKNTADSAARVAAEYKSMSDDFNTFSAEEEYTPSGYASSGSLTSSIFNNGSAISEWGIISYNSSTPSNTSISIKIRSGEQSNLADATSFDSCNTLTNGESIANSNCVSTGDQYVQYQVILNSSDSAVTPTFSEINSMVVVSVNISSDGNVNYGTLPPGSSKSTTELSDTQTAANNGNVTQTLNIRGQNTSCPWTLASSSGSNQYIHQFCNDTSNDCSSPPTNYNNLTTNYQTLASGISAGNSIDFQLRITMPASSTCHTQQAANVTIQAIQE